jgi:hypothetical protein
MISKDKEHIFEKVKSVERWDKANPHQIEGIFSHYYYKKIIAEFPHTLLKKMQ